MAEDQRTERDHLKWVISILGDWCLNKVPNGDVSVFLGLEPLDQSRNLDMWRQLRETLAANEDLRHPEVLKYLRDEGRAAAGYWWYDSANWRQPSEADA